MEYMLRAKHGQIMKTTLNEDEQMIRSWQTAFSIFVQHKLLLGALTTVFLGMFGLQTVLHWLIAFPAATVFYVLVFDEHTTWRRLREYRWYLTTHRLIFENQNEPEENASVPLDSIRGIRLWFWWSLKVQMDNGQKIPIDFIRGPRSIRQCILSAKTGARGAA